MLAELSMVEPVEPVSPCAGLMVFQMRNGHQYFGIRPLVIFKLPLSINGRTGNGPTGQPVS